MIMLKIHNILQRAADDVATHRHMWILVCIVSMASIADIPATPLVAMSMWMAWIYVICVGTAKGTAIYWLLRLCARKRWTAVAGWCLFGLFTLLTAVSLICYGLYGFGLTRRLIMVILQTNRAEVSGFMPSLWDNLRYTLLSWPFLTCPAVLAAACIGIGRMSRRTLGCVAAGVTTAGILLFGAFCIRYHVGRSGHLMILRVAIFGSDAYRSMCQYEDSKNSLPTLPQSHTAVSRHLAETVVVVIGESASRDHLSLYGYPLPTTPRADSMARELFVFADAIGSSAATIGNMDRILSLKPDDTTEGDALNYPRLIDIMGHAGYRTWWLSNQERGGIVPSTAALLASDADVTAYVSGEAMETLALQHDHALLPELTAALADTARYKLVFMHLIGSHAPARLRYPAEEGVFTAADELRLPGRPWLTGHEDAAREVAEYDNSIRYTDRLLADTQRLLARSGAPVLMIYFADHGEHIHDERLFSGRDIMYVRVPLVVWANDAWLSANPDRADALRATRQRPMSTANFAHMLMNLTGTSYAGYDASLDVLSPDYIVRPRYVDEAIWPGDKR